MCDPTHVMGLTPCVKLPFSLSAFQAKQMLGEKLILVGEAMLWYATICSKYLENLGLDVELITIYWLELSCTKQTFIKTFSHHDNHNLGKILHAP